MYAVAMAEYLLLHRIDIMYAEGTDAEGHDCERESDEGVIQFARDGQELYGYH